MAVRFGMKMDLETTGLNAMRRKVRHVDGILAEDLLLKALKRGAEIIELYWVAIVPVDTGRYMESIHVEVIQGGGYSAAVKLGTDINKPPYPFFLEYGTVNMPPYPSARPAWDARIEIARNEIRKSIEHDLRAAYR